MVTQQERSTNPHLALFGLRFFLITQLRYQCFFSANQSNKTQGHVTGRSKFKYDSTLAGPLCGRRDLRAGRGHPKAWVLTGGRHCQFLCVQCILLCLLNSLCFHLCMDSGCGLCNYFFFPDNSTEEAWFRFSALLASRFNKHQTAKYQAVL